MFLQWEIRQTSPVLFSLEDKKRPHMCILHLATKYAGGFGVEDHHAGEVVVFIRDRKGIRGLMPVLTKPGNLTPAQKYTMVTKDNTEMWKYYEYP